MERTRTLFTLLLLYVAWPLYQAFDFTQAQLFAAPLDVVNYVASIFSYNWLLLNVLLALKIPLLQRLLPYDFRVRTHIVTSMAMVGFLAFHATNYFFVNPKDINLVTWSLLLAFTVMVSLSVLWVPLPGFKKWVRATAYDGFKGAHKVLSLGLAGLAYVHVLDAKILGVGSAAATFGYQALFVVTLAAFVAARVRNLALPRFRVAAVTNEGSVTHLTLAGERPIRFRAGQFAFLRFDRPGLRAEEHPFSFTNSGPGTTLEFAIKRVGDFTAKLAQLQVGDPVRVNGGFGAFRLPRAGKGVVLIGTGIGAAPLMSLLRGLATTPRRGPVTAIVAADSRADLVEPEWLDQLPSLIPDLNLRVLVSKEGDPRIDESLLLQELDAPGDYDYYLCSSSGVRKNLLGALDRLNVPAHQVHYEGFTFG